MRIILGKHGSRRYPWDSTRARFKNLSLICTITADFFWYGLLQLNVFSSFKVFPLSSKDLSCRIVQIIKDDSEAYSHQLLFNTGPCTSQINYDYVQ